MRGMTYDYFFLHSSSFSSRLFAQERFSNTRLLSVVFRGGPKVGWDAFGMDSFLQASNGAGVWGCLQARKRLFSHG